jgi:alkanesulfonate monooxygenase SsuD/methylene tetrahydromethanopterin reductase-like flavin-dependent oxidoreductase (luciferase family)
MEITPWLFEFFHELRDPVGRDDPQAIQAHYRWYLDLWTQAEQRGFEGIFFSEHHFGAGYSPSPNLVIAAMSQRTTTLRLGVIGTVTPYSTPWRVVEEFAMLDHLTGGRLEMGIVSGIPPEQGYVGITPAVAAERHAETIDVVAKALRDPVVTHHGTHWSFDELRIVPRPLQSPPPVWTATRTAASSARAGGLGWKACGGFLSVGDMAAAFDAYRNAAADAGHPTGPEQLGIRRMITFVDDERDRAAAVRAGKQHLVDVLTASVGPLPPWAAVLDAPDGATDVVSDDEFVGGTPAQVAEQLVEQCRAVGAGHMAITFGVIEPKELEAAHDTFAREVGPVLRRASVG